MQVEDTSLLNGRVKLRQQAGGLRASTDTVLLAAAVQMKQGEALLDMGCATGGVGLCVIERLGLSHTQLTGIDIQSDLIELARYNAPDGNFIHGDVTDTNNFDDMAFDHIVMNPPYFESGKKQANPDATRNLAFESDNFTSWMKSALRWLKHGGTLTMIHKPDALGRILEFANGRFGDIQIWPIYSNPEKPAIRIILSMKRNRKSPLIIRPAIALYDEQGNETVQARSILRDGIGL